MLTLYIFRHARAVHDPAFADFDRPLTHGGVREAAEMGKLMADRDYRPARIICSSSQRTRETLAGALGGLGHEHRIEMTRRLYDAGDDRLLDILHEQEDAPSLMLIGHNPGLEQLARGLGGSGDGVALGRLHDAFKPASLAVIAFDTESWSDIRLGNGRLIAFETPSS